MVEQGVIESAPEGVEIRIPKVWQFSETSPDAMKAILEEPTSEDTSVLTLYEDDINTLAALTGQNVVNWRVEGVNMEKLGYRAIIETGMAWDPERRRTARLLFQSNMSVQERKGKNFRAYMLPSYPFLRKADDPATPDIDEGMHTLVIMAQIRKETSTFKATYQNGKQQTYEDFIANPRVGGMATRTIKVRIVRGKRPAGA